MKMTTAKDRTEMLQWYWFVAAVADGCTGGDWEAAERLLLERADEIVEWLKNEE